MFAKKKNCEISAIGFFGDRSSRESCEMLCGKKRENCALTSGIVFIGFGLFLLIFWEDTLKKLLVKKFQLSPTSKTYEPWAKSQVPIYIHFYFFNWTNPSDLKNHNYKPEFTEVGPYKFWEKIEKVNVTWNENGTVSYRRVRRWYFDREGTKRNLSDKITTVNTVALMAGGVTKTMPYFSRIPLNMLIASTQQISVTRTVSEFLFEGYIDPLLTAGRKWPPVASRVPYDKFGWFYQRNGSSSFDGYYNVQTGENGMEIFDSVSRWNYRNETGFYSGKCGQVKGSGGEFWPWNRNKETSIYLFSPDMCRYIEYKYLKEITIDGLGGYKYVADANLFDNGTLDSDNQCFCNGDCLAAGVLNISVCRYGAPVFTSYPHFYLADPYYLEEVGGMKPNQNLHENYVLLEPVYGMPMDIAARFQINVLVQSNKYIALLNGVKQIMFPILWLDQKVYVPSERLFLIKILRHLPAVNFAFSVILIAVGIFFILRFVRCKVGNNHRAVKVTKIRNGKKKNRNLNLLHINEKTSLHQETERLTRPEIKSVIKLNTDM